MYHRQRFPSWPVWGNGLGQSFILTVTLSSGQEEWYASSGSHSFEVHSCEQFQRMVRFGGWCRIVISLGNGSDSHSLGQTHSLQVALCLVPEKSPREVNGPGSTIRERHSLGQTHSLQVAFCFVSEEWPR
jgi:hypothetical protein